MKLERQEISDSINEAYVMLPPQYFLKVIEEPERNLMAMLLKDSIYTYLKYYNKKHRKIFKEEHKWLFNGEEENYFYSFKNICSHLELDHQYIRNMLSNLTEEKREILQHRFKFKFRA
mgnify:CR=1 FL=1